MNNRRSTISCVDIKWVISDCAAPDTDSFSLWSPSLCFHANNLLWLYFTYFLVVRQQKCWKVIKSRLISTLCWIISHSQAAVLQWQNYFIMAPSSDKINTDSVKWQQLCCVFNLSGPAAVIILSKSSVSSADTPHTHCQSFWTIH